MELSTLMCELYTMPRFMSAIRKDNFLISLKQFVTLLKFFTHNRKLWFDLVEKLS